ncbi:hypothetical protein [Gallaecimonas pentaromativorans]|uniref:hypothetical protein n=1 Tax=Gallaecimonas pentaromativorans TaxID=584787 RepID=UPI003A8CCFE4
MPNRRYLYLQTADFADNNAFAQWLLGALEKEGVTTGNVTDEDFMQVVEANVAGMPVSFYLGKTEDDTTPPTWLVWPQQQWSWLSRLLGKANYDAEAEAQALLEKAASSAGSFTHIEWGDK